MECKPRLMQMSRREFVLINRSSISNPIRIGCTYAFGIDLPNKFTLALIAGLTEFIPYLGPFMGMVPAILLGILWYGWRGGLFVLGLYRLIQQSENNILVPMVMYQTLGISPLLILICMIIGGSILWFIGIILAVPIAVIINILFEDYNKPAWKKHVQ